MAVTIYRTTDRIPVKIGDVTIWIAPTNNEDKARMYAAYREVHGEKEIDTKAFAFYAVKYSVRAIDGVQEKDGSKLKLQFEDEEKTVLTDESTQDVFLVCNNGALINASVGLMNEIKEHEINGAIIDLKKTRSVKKK